MRVSRPVLLFLAARAFNEPIGAQQTPQPDPQAATILPLALTTMGDTVPVDSVVAGRVALVAGSRKEMGTSRILTCGMDQTAEQIHTANGSQAEIYSRGTAALSDGISTKKRSREWAASSESPLFPLPLVAAA